MKKFIIASTLALAAASSLAANTEIGSDLVYDSINGSDAHLNTKASFEALLAAGTYTYSFSFVTGGKTDVTAVWLSTSGDKYYNGLDDLQVFLPAATLTAGVYTGTFTLTQADKIFLNVNAIRRSNTGYDVAYSITPVPEPETYAMFAAGLAALGLMTRRRKQA